MKWIRRLLCRLFGHPEPAVAVNGDKALLVYCPRCLLIHLGNPEAVGKTLYDPTDDD